MTSSPCACSGERYWAVPSTEPVCGDLRGPGAGDAEVGHPRAALASTSTLCGLRSRWTIPRCVGEPRPGEDLADDLDRLSDRQPARDQVLERSRPRRTPSRSSGCRRLAAVVDADHVRVLEPGGGLGLAAEALDELLRPGRSARAGTSARPGGRASVLGRPDVGHAAGADAARPACSGRRPAGPARASSASRRVHDLVAIGPATSPPKQPVHRSTIAATAICGSSAGAKPMNQGWLMPGRRRSRRCRSCRRASAERLEQAGRGALLRSTLTIISVTCGRRLLAHHLGLLVGVELLDRAPVGVGGRLEEGRLHQLAAVGDRRRDLRHLGRGRQQLALRRLPGRSRRGRRRSPRGPARRRRCRRRSVASGCPGSRARGRSRTRTAPCTRPSCRCRAARRPAPSRC